MYNEYFGFKESPFSIAPDPRYLYMTAQHRDALAHLVYGLNSDGGCILLTGEVGTGKTTICRCLLEQIPDKTNIALVLNPKISALELLETICDELNIQYPENNKSIKVFTDCINHFLIEHNAKNERTVLIIDEAQNLDCSVLEQLRLLTNLETEKRKLLQIIILGQPELLDILAKIDMRQLAQRITARYHLKPLSREEIKAYLNHRLAIAGQNIQIFPEQTITQLYKLSNGIPRLINIICDRALLGCYVENSIRVEKNILKKAANEVSGELKKIQNKNTLSKYTFIFAGLLISSLVFASIFFGVFDNRDTMNANTNTVENVIPTITPEIKKNEDQDLDNSQIQTTESTSQKSNEEEKSPSINTNIPSVLTTEQNHKTEGDVLEQYSKLLLSRYIKDSYNGPNKNSTLNAYQELFEQWQITYDRKSSNGACKQALTAGLRCLHKQGNLNSLRQHNRPAILKLFTPSGESAYLTLLALKGEQATLSIADKTINVSTSTLDQHWLGQYTLLWRQPDSYTKAETPKKTGKLADWLLNSFSRIKNNEASSNKPLSEIMPIDREALIETVKQFQMQQGLTADGVVGPVTVIHINTAIDKAVPVLNQ